MIDGWFGRSPWREDRPSKKVPGWIALAAVLGAFAGGFWLGGKTSLTPSTGTTGLDARSHGRDPGFIDESPPPASKTFLMAAAYLGGATGQTSAAAKNLAEYLQGKGLKKARPYLYPTPKGQVWVVAVYYDGDTELQKTTALMRGLPADVPDAAFVSLRQSQESQPNGWPRSFDVVALDRDADRR